MRVLVLFSILFVISNIPSALATVQHTAYYPYDHCDRGASGTGTIRSMYYNYWGYVTGYVDTSLTGDAWALFGDENYFSSAHVFTISAQVSLTAYMTTGWAGSAQIYIYLEIRDASNPTAKPLWSHLAWSSSIGPNQHRSYSSFTPTISATTDTSCGGSLIFCVRFDVAAQWGATVCRSSTQTTSDAKLIISTITWSY